MADIPIRITLRDIASDALKSVGSGVENTLGGIRAAADKTRQAFASMGNIARGLNAVLEIGKKGFELFRAAILDSVTAALEFRDKNDPVIKQFDEMKRSVEILRARLGDALIPVFQALGEAFGPLIEATSQWLEANRKIIGSKLISFLGKAAILLTKGIATGVILVSKAWTGWQLIIEGVQLAANSFFGLMARGVEAALGAMKALAKATGRDGLAADLGAAQDAVAGLGDVFEESADKSLKEMFRIQNAQAELEKKAEETSKTIEAAISLAVVRGQAIVRESVQGTTRSIEEQEEIAKEIDEARKERDEENAARLDALAARRIEAIEFEAQAFEAAMKIQDEALSESQARREASAERVAGAFASATSTIIKGFGDMAKEGEDSAEIIGKAMVNAVLDILAALAAEAAAAILTRTIEALGFPAGPIVGAAAAAAILASFAVLRSAATSGFADGGFVNGGTPGRDSVPILAQEGEFVMSRDNVAGFRKFASKILGGSSGTQLAQIADRSTESVSKAGDVVTNTTIINRMWKPQRLEEMRLSRDQMSSIGRLQALGMLRTNA